MYIHDTHDTLSPSFLAYCDESHPMMELDSDFEDGNESPAKGMIVTSDRQASIQARLPDKMDPSMSFPSYMYGINCTVYLHACMHVLAAALACTDYIAKCDGCSVILACTNCTSI